MPDGLAPVEGGSVTTTPGFHAAGVACGLKPSGALDVGVLAALGPCASGYVDTTSALPSAPVRRNRGLDRSRLRAVVVNAGSANAATGSPGVDDAHAMARRAAVRLALDPGEVAVCSTGTIGDRLAMDLVGPGIDAAAAALGPDGGADFNRAICTTDRAPKGGAFRLALGTGAVTIGAAAKGAGMIRPDMATMLAFITTDAAVDAGDLQAMTAAAAAASFNRISVDAQMSPSDTLLVMAGGDGPPLAGADRDRLGDALAAVCRWLAVQMVKDGEGAEHAVRVLVRGAADAAEAERVARAVGESSLVKTALFGRDPNWGRVSQAVGQALAGRAGEVREPSIAVDGVPFGAPGALEVMGRDEYDLEVGLGRGDGEAELWVSDLGHAYITINAEYHT
ncbi:bifunctional glutamate N-acetyltransferase/amino-acid acetyltransferase ArgJ [Miltoncostaea marina]|uniref:bifunctional glutamate N-acetyltransferase/amino-acid acetyltransferase ArgJ n=1 Tax=Miltoncostaea marina TaxID=2843215 RepID=UPI001C3CACDD|nr:bifunctional glutamate N-acetyltransferase/amino-acid acetyltransferase ArgJ [Miltoncostaea marina]